MKIENIFKIFINCFIVCTTSVIVAQTSDINFEQLWLDEGLSQSQVKSIIQDKDGFLWIATYEGLNRYDGYNFQIYYSDPTDSNSLSDDDINNLYEDKTGKIWIGTYGNGIDIFDKATESFTNLCVEPGNPNSLCNNRVQHILQDRKGLMWIATEVGLNIYDPQTGKFEHYLHNPDNKNSISNNDVIEICEDSKDNIWIATNDGLNLFNRKNKKFFHYKNAEGIYLKLHNNWINKIYEDRNGNLWIGTRGGLYKSPMNNVKFELINFPFNPPTSITEWNILSILEDSKNVLWIGTTTGLIRYDNAKDEFNLYTNDPLQPYSICNNNIENMIEDNSGNIWLGTDMGLAKFNPYAAKFKHIGGNLKMSPLPELGFVWSFCQDDQNFIWIGTNNGLFKWNRKSNDYLWYKHNYTNPNSISNNEVYSLLKSKNGNIWIGTYKGLDEFDITTQKFIHHANTPKNPNPLGKNIIFTLAQDHQGIIWIGTCDNGLCKYDPVTKKFYSYFNNPKYEKISKVRIISSILEDNDKNIWFGTDGNGLFKFDKSKDKFTQFVNDPKDYSSLGSNSIYYLIEDLKGKIVIATEGGGLNFFDKESETFSKLTVNDKLSSNTSLAVLEDNYGNLWISNNNGLTKFNSSDSSMIYFSEKDGLQSKEFNSSSAFKNKKGEMFFGGVNGFNMFHPDSIRFNENIPQIAITDIKILNKSIPITKTNEQNKLTISYFENFISFEFAVLDFTNPEKNEYKHMMEGFDEDWIYSGNKHTTDYTNLDPGDYIFKVIGCNSDGVWNLEGSSIALSILPPIWMTWWFRISLVVFILSILWYIHKIRLKRLIELEKLRTKIASDLHDEVGASLTSLSIQSQMLSYEKDDSKLDKRIETINNISKNTINTMRDVVWSIDSRNDTLQNLIEKMKETAFQILNERDIDIKYSIEIETPEKKLNIAIRQNIYLIFKEAINNTVKHSNATNIKVIVIVKNNSFDMSIKDNGSGISKLEENHHYGGLSNMKLRARKIGGELKIINRNGVLIKLIIRKI